MVTPFYLFGSRSSQFDQTRKHSNPLPECPKTPNCVRITRHMKITPEQSLQVSKRVLRQMEPSKTEVNEEIKSIKSVFTPFIFKDDVTIMVEEAEPGTCYLHIRSASRTGRSDLGVNRRRVKKFLKLFYEELR